MKKRIPILLYHRILPKNAPGFDRYTVSAETFTDQMRYLQSAGYKPLRLTDLVTSLRDEVPVTGKRVIITFDDGYRDNYLYALPVMEQCGFSPCIFLVSDFLAPNFSDSSGTYLSLTEVKAMQRSGCEFQSHGKSHRVLTELSPDEIHEEVSVSKQVLEAELGPVACFTYPLGRFTNDLKKAVRDAGYIGACGGLPKLGSSIPDRFEIGRTEIFESDSMVTFMIKVATGFSPLIFTKKLAGAAKRRITRGYGHRRARG